MMKSMSPEVSQNKMYTINLRIIKGKIIIKRRIQRIIKKVIFLGMISVDQSVIVWGMPLWLNWRRVETINFNQLNQLKIYERSQITKKINIKIIKLLRMLSHIQIIRIFIKPPKINKKLRISYNLLLSKDLDFAISNIKSKRIMNTLQFLALIILQSLIRCLIVQNNQVPKVRIKDITKIVYHLQNNNMEKGLL